MTRGQRSIQSGGQPRRGGSATLTTGKKRSLLDRNGEQILIPKSEEKEQAKFEKVLEQSIHDRGMAYPSLLADLDNPEGAKRIKREEAELLVEHRRKLEEEQRAGDEGTSSRGEQPSTATNQTKALMGQAKIAVEGRQLKVVRKAKMEYDEVVKHIGGGATKGTHNVGGDKEDKKISLVRTSGQGSRRAHPVYQPPSYHHHMAKV